MMNCRFSDESFACFGCNLPVYRNYKNVEEEEKYDSWNNNDDRIHNIIAENNGLTLTQILECFNKRRKKKITLQHLNARMNKLFQQDYDLYIEDRKKKRMKRVKSITTGEVTIKEVFVTETIYFIDKE
jgi:hypothetical protein